MNEKSTPEGAIGSVRLDSASQIFSKERWNLFVRNTSGSDSPWTNQAIVGLNELGAIETPLRGSRHWYALLMVHSGLYCSLQSSESGPGSQILLDHFRSNQDGVYEYFQVLFTQHLGGVHLMQTTEELVELFIERFIRFRHYGLLTLGISKLTLLKHNYGSLYA